MTALAVAGAAIALGAALEVHTTVTQVVTKSAGITIGRALTAAAAAGDIVEVWLIPN
jgi:plasmid maintenance system antidote protein VapI